MKNKLKDRDLGLMIVACGMIIIGIIGLFFDKVFGGIGILVGVGFLVMGYLSKKPQI